MNNKLIAVVLVVGGTVLGWFGWQEYQSFGSKLTEAVRGTPPDRALWMIGGAAVCIAAGVFLGIRRG